MILKNLAILAVLLVPSGYPQALFRSSTPTLAFNTAANATFNLTATKSGATLHWIWPNGTTSDSNNPTVNIPAGQFLIQSADGFSGLTVLSDNWVPTAVLTGSLRQLPSGLTNLYLDSSTFSGTLPSLPSGLTNLYLDSSTFSGTLPSLPSGLTNLDLGSSTFSGTLPTLPSGMTGSIDLWNSTFSGTLPALPSGMTGSIDLPYSTFSGPLPTLPSGMTGDIYLNDSTFSGTLPTLPSGMTGNIYLTYSTFSGYTSGAFATQKSLLISYMQFSTAASVNAALTDAVTSLGISGRVTMNPFWIAGSSPAPTGAGVTAKATLVSAGWTVTTN